MNFTDIFMKWLPIFAPLLRAGAQAIIEGSRAAGVTHETVALTVAKSVQHLLNGVQPQTTAQVPAPPPAPR